MPGDFNLHDNRIDGAFAIDMHVGDVLASLACECEVGGDNVVPKCLLGRVLTVPKRGSPKIFSVVNRGNLLGH